MVNIFAKSSKFFPNLEQKYSQAANRRGGRLLIFQDFSDPPPPTELIRFPHLLIFKKKFWSGRFY